jgi:ATP-binding cassette subfamily F protein 3
MPVLAATNIALSFGERRILDDVSLTLEPAERVGLVGRNGSGKSTLLKIIAGAMKADSGSVVLTGNAHAGYLAQEPEFHGSRTLREEAAAAFSHIEDLETELHEIFHAMADATGDALDRLLRRQEAIEKKIDAAGGLATDHKIDAVLHGLGFTDDQFGVPVPGLSGGQRARLALAKLLLGEPEVLLLDEPTNHLDIQGRLWLEDFLKSDYRGAVLMISHDRYLLDNVVSRIIEVEPVPIEGGRLIEYPGNYAAFRKLRAERREAQRRAWENQQTKFRQEEAYIRKYKAGQRAKQAKGRETRLEREKAGSTIERPLEMETMRLTLPKAERPGDLIASVRGLCKQYRNDNGSAKILFHDLDLSIERGQRWGVIGPNGAGKTTLVRCLLGETDADAGTIQPGSRLSIGYFRQSHETIDPEKTVVRYLQDIVRKECPNSLLSEQAARNLAGAFLFSGDDQEKELGLLSGGERARAVLAGLMVTGKNVLVLDEPTNHLDIPSAERLEDALRRPDPDSREKGLYDGTLILISHDRALLDACCDRLLILDGTGEVEVFLGNYTEWHEKQLRASRAAAAPAPRPKAPDRDRRADLAPPPKVPDAPAGSAKKSKWSWMRLEQLEEKIAALSEQIRSIDRELEDPDVWRDITRANRLTEQRDDLQRELEAVEAEWVRKAD